MADAQVMQGLDQEEMVKVVTMGQTILGMCAGQPADRLFNACLWLQLQIARSKGGSYALACLPPLQSLGEQLAILAEEELGLLLRDPNEPLH